MVPFCGQTWEVCLLCAVSPTVTCVWVCSCMFGCVRKEGEGERARARLACTLLYGQWVWQRPAGVCVLPWKCEAGLKEQCGLPNRTCLKWTEGTHVNLHSSLYRSLMLSSVFIIFICRVFGLQRDCQNSSQFIMQYIKTSLANVAEIIYWMIFIFPSFNLIYIFVIFQVMIVAIVLFQREKNC